MQGFHDQKGGFCFVSGVSFVVFVCLLFCFVLKDNRADRNVVYTKKEIILCYVTSLIFLGKIKEEY